MKNLQLKRGCNKLAFTTLTGRVKKGSPKYELPRVRIDKGTGFLSFMNKVK